MRFYRTLAFASVSMLAMTSPAFAQEAPAEGDEASSSEIIVQARRKDESVQDVPLVVNAVTAEDVNKLNLRDFKDITSVVPGLTMATNSNGIGTTSSVRGVNYDVNASGNNGTIEYYMNDAPVSAAILFTQMYDIGQVEVLRGPQGTLRGRASPSGSITVSTRKPDLSEIGVAGRLTANDISGYNGSAAINLPLVQDVIGIRIAGVYDKSQGNRVRSINSTEEPLFETTGGRISLRATPVDFLELNAMYQTTKVDAVQFDQVASFSQFAAGAAASTRVITPEERLGISSAPRRNNQRFDTYNWSAALSLAGQKLTYVGQYSKAAYYSEDPSAGDQINFFAGQQVKQVTNTTAIQESHEIRLQNEERIGGMFDYVIGYFNNTLDPPTSLTRPTAIGLPNGTLVATSLTPIERFGDSAEESYFGNLTVHLGDAAELSGGVRHIKYRWNAGLKVAGNLLDDAVNGCARAANCQPLSKTIYSLSAKYRVTDSLMAYASFGTSWRPPINVVGDFSLNKSARERSFLDLPAETSKSYELGIKSDWLDKRVRLNVSVYQQDYENFPYRSSSGIYYVNYGFVGAPINAVVPQRGIFNFVGAVPVRVRGVEVEGQFQVSDNFNLGGNINYSMGRVKNGIMPCNDLNGDGNPDVLATAPTLAQLQTAYGANNLGACRSNDRSASAPVWSGVVQGEYKAAISDSMEGYVRGLLSWYGKSGNDHQNPYDNVGRYSLTNVFLGLRDPEGAWDVTLFAKNVFNNQTVTSVSNGPLATSYRNAAASFAEASAVSTYAGINMTAPREFGVTARFAFGSR